MGKSLALITGSTSGIGLACAAGLASKGVNLIITGRRRDRLEQIKTSLIKANSIEVTTCSFDISNREEALKACEQISNLLPDLSILINNAGLAVGMDPIQSGKIEDWEAMIDTNVKGMLYMTRACLPHMLKRKSGHIVNIGSVAGRWTYPTGGVYCATKYAVRALSEGLRLDVMGSGIRVTNIAPGWTETEFTEVRLGGDKLKAKAQYKGMTPLSPSDIADTVLWSIDRPPHVNIQEIIIFPTDQAGVGYVHRSEP